MHLESRAGGSGEICSSILAELPEWFGIDEANADYIAKSEAHENVVAFDDAGEPIGLLTITVHSAHSAEVYLMAVRRALHRSGVGRALLVEAERVLRDRGFEFLQVKTLSASSDDAGYARTREFYKAMGFRELEEFRELWDPSNPALQMIKAL